MRFGVLAFSPIQTELVLKSGYDYAEPDITAIMNCNGNDFNNAKKYVFNEESRFDVFSNPLPPDVRICELGFNSFVWREYLKKVCFRISELRGKSIVFGNGHNRSLPFEGDVQSAREAVMTFIVTLCGIAREHGLTVIVEPLEESFSNIYNTLGECGELIKLLGAHNLTSMCSYRYFCSKDAEIDDIEKNRDIIGHVRISCPSSQYTHELCPREDDAQNYKTFFNKLVGIQYDGTVSVSANTYNGFETEIFAALDLLKKLTQ